MMSIQEKAKQLRQDIPALFLALKHRQTPAAAKILACIAVGYALSPIDLIPDFIPVLGYLDDLLLLPALIVLAVKLIPEAVMKECRKKAADLWRGGKPKKWYFAIPIVCLWLLAVWAVAKLILLHQ